jgi:hypothetical protein
MLRQVLHAAGGIRHASPRRRGDPATTPGQNVLRLLTAVEQQIEAAVCGDIEPLRQEFVVGRPIEHMEDREVCVRFLGD